MKYFILRQNPYFSERLQLDGWQEKIDPKWICFQDFYKVPRRCIVTATLGENLSFPDIVTAPFLLLSGLMLDMAKMYGELIYTRNVIVMNAQEQQGRHYHLSLLETVERGHPLWGGFNLAYMEVNRRKEIAVSQDFAESILRRGAVGIVLKEIDLGEEQFYGK